MLPSRVFAFILLSVLCGRASARPSISQAVAPTAGPLQFVGSAASEPNVIRVALGEIDPIVKPRLQQDFKLRNTGTKPLRVTRLQSSCGCTSLTLNGRAVENDPVDIPAGGLADLHSTVDFFLIRPGPITKYIWVYVEGEKKPVATVETKFNLRPGVRFQPDMLTFPRTKSGEAATMRVAADVDARLRTAAGRKELPALTSSDPDILVKPVPARATDAPADSGRIKMWYEVTVSPKASLGVHFASLSYPPSTGGGETVDPRGLILAQVSLPVQAVVDGRIAVNPAIALFGTVESGKECTHRVALEGKDPTALRGLTIVTGSPWLSALVVPSSDPKRAGLELKIDRAAPAGTYQTQVLLRTEDGQKLILPVTVHITAPGKS